MRYLRSVAFAVTYLCGVLCCQAGVPTTRSFEDNGAELQNPGMGWALHYYDNIPTNYGSRLALDDQLESWPGLGFIYLRIPWSFIEPHEGEFNWSVVDTPLQRFRHRGRQACFRFSCSESWMEYATPEWVREAGARGYRFRPGDGITSDGPYWEPNFDDPVFLEKLGRFLAACATRYDGHPDISFIDIGSFGVWGEGHTWASTRKPYPTDTIKRHIELHRKHFKKTQIIAQDDFLSRPGTESVWKVGVNQRGFDLAVPRAWYGKAFQVSAGLWQPDRQEMLGRLPVLGAGDDGRVPVGTLSFDDSGRAAFEPLPLVTESVSRANRVAGSITAVQVVYDPVNCPHSLKLLVTWQVPEAYPVNVQAFVHLNGHPPAQEQFVLHEEREDEDLTRYLVDRGLGFRDDSILVQPLGAAYFHAVTGQQFWRTAPAIMESEHYGGSLQRGNWGDGTGFLHAIEDYHASYASIHWWPHEFLAQNRELVRDINRRIGYRFRLKELGLPQELRLGQELPISWTWQNGGVAPPYTDYFPAITLMDGGGGIAAVVVDDRTNLRELPVALRAPEAKKFERKLGLPFQLDIGTYDVYVSVGDRLGTPIVALPLDGGSADRRYQVAVLKVVGN